MELRPEIDYDFVLHFFGDECHSRGELRQSEELNEFQVNRFLSEFQTIQIREGQVEIELPRFSKPSLELASDQTWTEDQASENLQYPKYRSRVSFFQQGRFWSSFDRASDSLVVRDDSALKYYVS